MKKSNRLLVSGCSYTDYAWPTWADYLSYYYEDFSNVGNAGSDNANIAREIIKYARQGDTVVILWSSWHRQKFWRDKIIPTPKNSLNHWDFHFCEVLDRDWVTKFYHPIDRLIVSLDYQQMVQMHSQNLGFDVYHFYAFPWLTGELEKKPHEYTETIMKQYCLCNDYSLEQSLDEFKKQYWNKEYSTRWSTSDYHPGPMCHLEYLKKVIAPKMNISINPLLDLFAGKHQSQIENHDGNFDKSNLWQ